MGSAKGRASREPSIWKRGRRAGEGLANEDFFSTNSTNRIGHSSRAGSSWRHLLHRTDEDWPEAITIGEEIIRDYPNSRMAQEVRDKMDLLRTRAATQPA